MFEDRGAGLCCAVLEWAGLEWVGLGLVWLGAVWRVQVKGGAGRLRAEGWAAVLWMERGGLSWAR